MIRYEFKQPNLLEIIILIAIIVLAIALWNYLGLYPATVSTLDMLAKENPTLAQIAYLKAIFQTTYVQTVLQWFMIVVLLFLATILEGIRDKL